MPHLELFAAAIPKPPENLPQKRKRVKKPDIQYLQRAELDRLFLVIDSPRDRAIFQLAYRAGLRASEVGLIDLRDYNVRLERVLIHALKGSSSGEHHCVREESKALHAWLKVRGAAPGPLFPSSRKSGIKRGMLDVLMKHYGIMADLPEKLRHFHVLKHSCCTHMLDMGRGIEEVKDWVRHVNIQSTAIYAKISNPKRQKVADELKDTWR